MLQDIIEIFTNPVLLCAVFSWLTAQILKLITTPLYVKNFSIRHTLFGSGGMPSSHAAAVCSTAASCGVLYGFDSVTFAISGVLAMIVMKDAVGVRREAGKQAGVLNQLTEQLNAQKSVEEEEKNSPKKPPESSLSELLGHSPLQVLLGALLGIAMAYFCQGFLFKIML